MINIHLIFELVNNLTVVDMLDNVVLVLLIIFAQLVSTVFD